MRRIRSEASTVCTPSRKRPSKRSPSSSARKSWKSSSLPLCGVAVSRRKWRVWVERSWPSRYRFVYLISPPKCEADILWASSQITRSHPASGVRKRFWTSSSRASLSRRAIASGVSMNQFPELAASRLSFVMISNRSWNRRDSSSCHCSARLPGQTTRQRSRSPRAMSSLIRSPAMMVLPAPGSSAKRNRSGCRVSMAS